MIKCQLCGKGSLTPFIIEGGAGVLAYSCDFCDTTNSEKIVREKVSQQFKALQDRFPRLYSQCETFLVDSGYYHAILDMSLALNEMYSQSGDAEYPYVTKLQWTAGKLILEFANELEFASKIADEVETIGKALCGRCGEWEFDTVGELYFPHGLCSQCTKAIEIRAEYLTKQMTPSK
jgi:hypothetical protein